MTEKPRIDIPDWVKKRLGVPVGRDRTEGQECYFTLGSWWPEPEREGDGA